MKPAPPPGVASKDRKWREALQAARARSGAASSRARRGPSAEGTGASLRRRRHHGLVEEEGARSRDGDGLRAHAQEPGCPAGGPGERPAPSGPGRGGPVEQRQRDEVEEGGEDLRPLRGVGHRLRLDRVEREEAGDHQRDGPGTRMAGAAQQGGEEGERRNHGREVQEQPDDVEADRVEPGRSQVEGEGDLRQAAVGAEHLHRRREADGVGGAKPHVGLDAPPVVEHERPRQRGPVCGGRAGEDGGQQQPRRGAHHRRAASAGTGGGVKGEARCRSARRAASARPWRPPSRGPRRARPAPSSPGRAARR